MPQTLEHPAPVEKDFLPLNGTDYVEFYVGNARQAAHYLPHGVRVPAGGLPRTGNRHARPRLLRAGAEQDPLRADHGARARTIRSPSIVRLHGDGVHDIALWVDDAESAWRETTERGARSVREPETLQRRARRSAHGLHRDLRRHHPHLRRARAITAASSCRDSRRSEGEDTVVAPGGPEVHRPHGGQRRLGRDEPLGRFLPRRDGLPHVQALRRQGHLHRILGADVEGDVERQRARQVPHQRAGRRASANRRSKSTWSSTAAPACSTSPWRPTTSSRRWRAAATGRGISARALHLLRRPAGAGRPDRRTDRGAARNWASWWTATTKATCCRSSPARWRTGPRCSTK